MEKNAWPYVAGILDGEGSICASRRNTQGNGFHLQVVIYNTDTRLMKWLIQTFGGKYYVRTTMGGFGGRPGKVNYMWFPSGKKNKENFLLGIIPYLLLKREQAILAVEFLRLPGEPNSTAKEKLVEKIKALNHWHDKSVETNTQDGLVPYKSRNQKPKIESELTSDRKSDPVVTQGPLESFYGPAITGTVGKVVLES